MMNDAQLLNLLIATLRGLEIPILHLAQLLAERNTYVFPSGYTWADFVAQADTPEKRVTRALAAIEAWEARNNPQLHRRQLCAPRGPVLPLI